MVAAPDVHLPGAPSVVTARLLNDKRRALTRDRSSGAVRLWDLLKGRETGSFGAAVSLDAQEAALNPTVYVPPWCQLDCRLGRLMVHLEPPECFQAEVPASAVGDPPGGLPRPGDEATANLGATVLAALCARLEAPDPPAGGASVLSDSTVIVWGERPAAFGRLSHPPKAPGADEDEGEEAAGRDLPLGPPFLSAVPHLRCPASMLTAAHSSSLPQWVLQVLRSGGPPAREKEAKIPFSLKSLDPGDLQDVMPKSHRLTAPRLLRVSKVADFVREKLSFTTLPTGRDGAEGTGEDHIRILTADNLVLDPSMDLGTVVHFYGKPSASGTPLTLYFRRSTSPLPSDTAD